MAMGKRLSILLSCVFLTVLFSACNKSVDLKLRLQPGDKRVVELRSDVDVTMSLMGMEIPLPKGATERYALEVLSVDDSGAATAKVTTNIESLLGIWAAQFDTMGDGGSPLGKVGDFDLTVTIAPDGTVRSVDGMEPVVESLVKDMKEEMQKQMVQLMANMSPQAQAEMAKRGGLDGMLDEVAKGIREQLNDDKAQKKLQEVFDFYPSEPVRVGSTWSKDKTVDGIKESTTYTVAARGGGVMNINVKTSVSGSYEGMDAASGDTSLSGEESGTLQIDEATGWVLTGKMDSSVSGFLKGKGTDYIESRAE